MDLNKDAKLTFDEFKEGSKQDPTIVQVRLSTLDSAGITDNRLCLYTMVWSRMLLCGGSSLLDESVRYVIEKRRTRVRWVRWGVNEGFL